MISYEKWKKEEFWTDPKNTIFYVSFQILKFVLIKWMNECVFSNFYEIFLICKRDDYSYLVMLKNHKVT